MTVTIGSLLPSLIRPLAGVHGDDSTDDTTAFQAAINASAGRQLYIPQASGAAYKISAPLTVPSNTHLVLHPNAVIRQATKWVPVFDLLDTADVTIDGGYLKYTGDRTHNTAAGLRGAGPHDYGAGVWTNSDRTTIRNMRISGFQNGIVVSGWDGSALTSYHTDDCYFENILVDTVDMGVLCGGYNGLTIKNLRGTYTDAPTGTASPPPPHMIYAYGTSTHLGRNLIIDGCEAKNGGSSLAFQFKYVRGGIAKGLVAYNCNGLLIIHDCQDFAVLGPVATGDKYSGYTIEVSSPGGTTARIAITDPLIKRGTDGKTLAIDGDDVVVSGLRSTVAHSADDADIDVLIYSGNRNALLYPTIINTGAGSRTPIQINGGSGHRIIDPVLVNANIGVRTIAGDAYVRYDPASITFGSGGSTKRQMLDESGTSRYERMQTIVSETISGAITKNPNAAGATHYIYTVTTTSGWSINSAVSPCLGMALSFEIYNNSGGSLALTWNTGWAFRSLWTSPSNGNRTVVTFRYDGTTWQETGRAG